MQTNRYACTQDMASPCRPRQPLLRYSGKFCNADKIIRHFPSRHRIYVEPFGGGASVLHRKPRSFAEVDNNPSGPIVTMTRFGRQP